MRIPAPRSTKPLLRRLRHHSQRWWRSIIVVQDTPHRVAWGFAIGWLLGWLPIMGIQIPVAGVLTWILRGNILASMAAVWISNPLTVVPLYYLINRTGALFVGEAIRLSEIRMHINHMFELGPIDSVAYLFDTLAGALVAMFVGGMILGVLTAAPSYFAIKMMVSAYQARRMERRLRWLGIVEPPQPADVDLSPLDDANAETDPTEERHP